MYENSDKFVLNRKSLFFFILRSVVVTLLLKNQSLRQDQYYKITPYIHTKVSNLMQYFMFHILIA
jgi:hypothetical protein